MTDDKPEASPADEPTKHDKQPRPTLPLLQAFCIVALVVVFFLDLRAPDESAPPWLYICILSIAIGMGPAELIEFVKSWKGGK